MKYSYYLNCFHALGIEKSSGSYHSIWTDNEIWCANYNRVKISPSTSRQPRGSISLPLPPNKTSLLQAAAESPYTCYFNVLNLLTPGNSCYLVWNKFALGRRNQQNLLSGLLAFCPSGWRRPEMAVGHRQQGSLGGSWPGFSHSAERMGQFCYRKREDPEPTQGSPKDSGILS